MVIWHGIACHTARHNCGPLPTEGMTLSRVGGRICPLELWPRSLRRRVGEHRFLLTPSDSCEMRVGASPSFVDRHNQP